MLYVNAGSIKVTHKRIRKHLLGVTGKTEENQTVINGVFKLVDAQGVPLIVVLDYFNQNGHVVDWPDFITKALEANWNLRTIMARIEEALFEVHGPEYRDAVIQRCKMFLSTRGQNES